MEYYDRLVNFVCGYVKQREPAEEIVSELFVRLWLKRSQLSLISSPEAYLYVSAKNAALNYCRDNPSFKSVPVDEAVSGIAAASIAVPFSSLEDEELMMKLRQAIESLPARRKIIFKLVKEEGLKCREVAEILSLSVRTVENQLFKAVCSLAEDLDSYLGYRPGGRNKRVLFLYTVLPLLFL